MRTNLREAKDRLSAGGDMLNPEVGRAVTELRAEMRDVREVVDNMTPPAPAPATSEAHASSYEPAARDVPASESSTFYGAAPETASVATTTQHGELPPGSDRPAIPAQRSGTDSELPGDAVLPFDLIQQAVRDALAAELAPIGALLAESKDRGTEDASAVRDQLREAVQEVREQLQEARREARLELAALREEAIGLRAGLERLRSQSDDQEPAAGEVSRSTVNCSSRPPGSPPSICCATATSGSSSPPRPDATSTSGCRRRSPPKVTSGSGPPCPGAP